MSSFIVKHPMWILYFAALLLYSIQVQAQAKKIESDAKLYYCSLLFNSSPFSLKGLHDVHVSDWQLYGTGVMEGRAEVLLSQSNTVSNTAIGGALQIGYKANRFLSIALDIPFGFNAKSSKFGLNYGLKFDLLSMKRFSLGVLPKGGVCFASMSGTQIKMLPNKTPPIITEKYTFYEGESVSGGALGGSFTISGVAEIRLTNKLSLEVHGGYQACTFRTPTIWIGKSGESTEFKISDPEIINPINNPNGTISNADWTAEAEGKGLTFSIGIKIIHLRSDFEDEEGYSPETKKHFPPSSQ